MRWSALHSYQELACRDGEGLAEDGVPAPRAAVEHPAGAGTLYNPPIPAPYSRHLRRPESGLLREESPRVRAAKRQIERIRFAASRIASSINFGRVAVG